MENILIMVWNQKTNLFFSYGASIIFAYSLHITEFSIGNIILNYETFMIYH